MVDRVCVEPGVDNSKAVISATGNDTIVFPHVDSCMSVTAFVSPGTLVAGHAGVFDMATNDLSASKSISGIIDRIIEKVGGSKKIVKVLFVGSETKPSDPGYFVQADWKLPEQIAKFNAHQTDPKIRFYTVNTNRRTSGVDVFIELGSLRLKIQDFTPDRTRADTAAPNRGATIYEVPFHALTDKKL